MVADKNDDPTPVEIYDELMQAMEMPAPILDSFTGVNSERRKVAWSDIDQDAETLDDLIATLEEFRDELGGDTPVRDFECGHSVTISGTKYEDGETELRL